MKNYTDDQLLLRISLGNQHCFDELYERYYDILLNIGMSVNYDRDLVEDCIQEIFLSVWSSRERVTNIKFIKSYLIKSVTRAIIKEKVKERKSRSLDYHEHENAVTDEACETRIIRDEYSNEVSHVIKKAMDELPTRQKEALELKYYEGLDYEKVAVKMDVNYQSVINHVHKSIKKIRSNHELKKVVFSKVA